MLALYTGYHHSISLGALSLRSPATSGGLAAGQKRAFSNTVRRLKPKHKIYHESSLHSSYVTYKVKNKLSMPTKLARG